MKKLGERRYRGNGRHRAKRAGFELAQTLSIASQMALLCPSGMDIWMQRELTGCSDLERYDSRQSR